MFSDNEWAMTLALEEADRAFKMDEVPVGAVIIDKEGTVISRAHNLKEKNNDPCGHAEILAIQSAAEKLKNWRLEGMRLIVTLEPCVMCLGAIVHSRLEGVIFGAYDPKGGALSLGYNLYKDSRLNHRFDIVGGVNHYDCSRVISTFFKQKRKMYKDLKP